MTQRELCKFQLDYRRGTGKLYVCRWEKASQSWDLKYEWKVEVRKQKEGVKNTTCAGIEVLEKNCERENVCSIHSRSSNGRPEGQVAGSHKVPLADTFPSLHSSSSPAIFPVQSCWSFFLIEDSGVCGEAPCSQNAPTDGSVPGSPGPESPHSALSSWLCTTKDSNARESG